MLLQWQKDLEWGHPATDADHRQVVDLLNELDVLVATGAPAESVDRALADLIPRLSHHLDAANGGAGVSPHIRDLHRGWQDRTLTPNRADLRLLAHWWLDRLCTRH